jgi:hypothetical protein
MDELRRERAHWRDGPTLPVRIEAAAAREQELAETYSVTSVKMAKLHEQIRCGQTNGQTNRRTVTVLGRRTAVSHPLLASATSTIIVPRRRAAMLCYAMLCYALEQEAFYSIALFDSSTVIDRPIVN